MTKRHTDTKRVFEELGIHGWKYVPGATLGKGNQAQVCMVASVCGRRKAVCKFLPSTKYDKEIRRFRLEISILCNAAVAGPGIVQLYDYDQGSESRWHITEFGEPFDQYWKRFRSECTDSEILIRHAITICSQLADALGRCHGNGFLHRDIKPKNIVMTELGYPALIDFGVAFSKEVVDRLTNIDEAVGNAIYSPDRSRQFDSNPSAWIDVFQLSQLFLWMIEVKPPKNYWSRPIHWEHVVFDSNLRDVTEKSARALGAACSVPRQGPQNGVELKVLIRELFPLDTNPSVLEGPFTGVGSRVAFHKRQLAAEQIQKKAIDEEMVEAAIPIADIQYKKISTILLRLMDEFSNETGLTGNELKQNYHDTFGICARYHLGRKFALGGNHCIASLFTGIARLPGDLIVPEGAFHELMKTKGLCCIDFSWHWVLATGINDYYDTVSGIRFDRGLEVGVLRSGDLCWNFNYTHGPLVVGTIQELTKAMIEIMSREDDLQDIAIRL